MSGGFAVPTFEIVPHRSGFSPSSFSSSSAAPFTPAQIAHAYGIDKIVFPTSPDGSTYIVGDGAGQTIAIVDAYNHPNIVADLHAFDLQFGLPDPPLFMIVNQNGATSPLPANAALNGWATEISLDVEWAHALAPMANILLVEANSNFNFDLNIAVATARASGTGSLSALPAATVVSMSYGSSSGSASSQYSTPAGKTGVTYLASTGDSGGNGEWPASDPNVLAVGGTSLHLSTGSVYSSESAWSGSNGGFASNVNSPSYQSGVVPFGSLTNPGKRMTPDVSFDADPNTGVYVYDSYDTAGSSSHWLQVGGTSFSAPAWAALIAIADQGRGAAGALKTSDVQSKLYTTYTNGNYSYAFHDVITGGNSGNSAGIGYDYVTGIGTPRAEVIVASLAGFSQTPSLVAPSGTINATTPTFEWTSVAAATSYRLTLIDTTTSATILNAVSIASTSYTPSAALTNGHGYQWSVQAFEGTTALGPASSSLSFNVAITPNHAPLGSSSTVNTLEDTPYTFSVANFGFSDPDDNPAHTLLAVKVSTLPVAGALRYNNIAVTVGQFVPASDIAIGKLSFVPAANASGANYAQFTFQVQDNGGTANGGVDLDPTPKTLTINVDSAPEVASVIVDSTSWGSNFLNSLLAAGLGSGGYAIPAGVGQLLALPWINLNQIQIVFTQAVNVQSASLTLTGVNGGTYAFSGFNYNPTTLTATWSLPAPINTDRLLLHLHSTGAAAVTGATGTPLDGAWTDGVSSYPSGSGSPTGDFNFSFNVMPGDVSRDGIVNAVDIGQVDSSWLALGATFSDINGDGIVNSQELAVISSRWLQSLPVVESNSAAAMPSDVAAASAGAAAVASSETSPATAESTPAPPVAAPPTITTASDASPHASARDRVLRTVFVQSPPSAASLFAHSALDERLLSVLAHARRMHG